MKVHYIVVKVIENEQKILIQVDLKSIKIGYFQQQ
jgi:hypothetical protein